LRWYKVELVCSRKNASAVEEILIAIGSISISITNKTKQNIYEPGVGETPLWEKIIISALFENEIPEEKIISSLNLVDYSNLSISELEEINWVESYQRSFQPIQFGKNLVVVPSWLKKDKYLDKVIIKMDPGLAFGSGSHETTHLCLEYLDRNNPTDLSVLDYGCGSGILSIAAAFLGAKNVISTDIDPQALESCLKNSEKNGVSNKIKILSLNQLSEIKVDILIANILSKTLMSLRDEFLVFLDLGSKIVLSGIMEDQLNSVIKHYENFCNIESIETKNDWCLVELTKK